MSRIYQTLACPVEYTYEEKRSRFMAHIWPVSSKEEGFAHLANLKQKHLDARHHCWAYLIGNPEQAQTAGFNDDDEPSGTAGKPMLNVLTQRKVGDVFAVVVRYFGGIKLGAGGLSRAYGQAISQTLDIAEFRNVIPMFEIVITAEFSLENTLRNILKTFQIGDISVDYSSTMQLSFLFPQHQYHSLQAIVQDLSNGKARCQKQE